MNKNILGTLIVSLAIAQAGGAQARSPYIPRSERGQLTQQIVQRWSAIAARRHDTTPQGWAGAMASAFAKAPIEDLRRAARALTFDQLHDSFQTSAVNALVDGDLVFRRLPPCRIVNTRLIGTGDKILRNTTRTFIGQIPTGSATTFAAQGGHDSNCGIADDAVALALQVLAARPEGDGHLTVFPAGTVVPEASSLNYRPLQNISNEVPMGLEGAAGTNKTFNVFANQNTHLVVDVMGYYVNPPAPQPEPLPGLDCISGAVQISVVDDNGGEKEVIPQACEIGRTAVGINCGGTGAIITAQKISGCVFVDRRPGNGVDASGSASFNCCKPVR